MSAPRENAWGLAHMNISLRFPSPVRCSGPWSVGTRPYPESSMRTTVRAAERSEYNQHQRSLSKADTTFSEVHAGPRTLCAYGQLDIQPVVKRTPHRRGTVEARTILDKLQRDSSSDYFRSSSRFFHVFLNSTAHFQHAHWATWIRSRSRSTH